MMTDYKTYEEAEKKCKWSQVWDVFDGNKENFTIAHECIDRHIDRGVASLCQRRNPLSLVL
jgi:acetyl-CoA synthetase